MLPEGMVRLALKLFKASAAYLDRLQAKVDKLRRLQAETGAEPDAMMPAMLEKAFKGEL